MNLSVHLHCFLILRGNSKLTRGRNGFCARGKFHLRQLFKLKWSVILIEICKFFQLFARLFVMFSNTQLFYNIYQENKATLSKITTFLVCICHFTNIIMLNIVMYTPCYSVYIECTTITKGFSYL